MPVTARLSKRFYEVLGEDVANELVEWFNQVDATYRSDLRVVNELNFARFDAKLDQRLAEVRADLRSMEARLDASQHALRADLLKWMFGAWATLLGAMIALLKLG